jgi:hypothetical protein
MVIVTLMTLSLWPKSEFLIKTCGGSTSDTLYGGIKTSQNEESVLRDCEMVALIDYHFSCVMS